MSALEEENTPLMAADKSDEESESSRSSLTKSKQRIMLASLLSLQFCVLSTDSFLIPFFPTIAHQKGLTEIHVGIIYSAYEMTRFMMSPVYGSKVSSTADQLLFILSVLEI